MQNVKCGAYLYKYTYVMAKTRNSPIREPATYNQAVRKVAIHNKTVCKMSISTRLNHF